MAYVSVLYTACSARPDPQHAERKKHKKGKENKEQGI